MNKIISAIDKLLQLSLIAMISTIILAVLWQVLSRYLLQSPSSGSEEIARFLLIWISLLGAVYSYRMKMHLGLDVLVKKMQPKQELATQLLCHFLVLAFSVSVLFLGGINLVILTFNPVQISAALGIHMGYVYMVLPLSGVLMSLSALNELVTTWQQRMLQKEVH
ncbi:TRAP transporter small permease [Thalassotalea fonticola]|uniref:TRAP transporter small permease protein n=1 Tax=Thalassotalea fonticola TaxID=3065649 RepID=A0ABZ0GLN5_9GAMM|nr:TRAP transporter small permease [Colwelliaceae bacterium S1-1]